MKKLKLKTLLAVILTVGLVAGCARKEEQHRITEDGTEFGVKIDVMLVDGGSATLICPKFNNKPLGVHGRECYLRNYDNKSN